ncbi:hypothetical protein [Caballeronia glebae]|uniref:hypothetical protein n=1 Tax=Caballeronia glebae TaxID=1777143 RepID=UPI0038BD1A8D
MALTPAQTKRIEEAMSVAAANGAHPERIAEIRKTLVREFAVLKADSAKPAEAAK